MPVSTVGNFYLKEQEIEAYIQESKNGNIDAAFKLHMHYGFVMLDQEKSIKCLLRAAEGGHAIAQYNLAVYHETNGNTADANKWAAEALKNGIDKAKRILK